MTMLYGINKYSIAYYEKCKTEESLRFVTTSTEERFGYRSIAFDEAIRLFPDDDIVIFSTFANEIISSLVYKGYSLDKVSVYNRFLMQQVEANKLIHDYQYTNDEVLHCVYDLNNCLVTFDFFLYLVNAEIERIKRGLKFLKVHIVLPLDGLKDTCNTEYSTFRYGELGNIHYIKGRVSGIIEPLCHCHPKVLSVSRYTTDDFDIYSRNIEMSEVFPEDYTKRHWLRKYYYSAIESDLRHYINELREFIGSTKTAKQTVESFLDGMANGRKPVVITLREYDFQNHRNSKHSDWAKFIDALDDSIYFPIVIRDTYKVYSPFPDTKAYLFNEAAIDLKLRIALYEKAYVNLSVNCGPSSLFYFLKDCRSIEFREVSQETLSTTSAQMYKASLMIENEQPFYARTGENIVFWGVDNYPNIKSAFDLFVSNHSG
jgi:hypothetical protein